jgi:hypothetical protein
MLFTAFGVDSEPHYTSHLIEDWSRSAGRGQDGVGGDAKRKRAHGFVIIQGAAGIT